MTIKIKLIAAFKIWLVIYPSITAFLFLFGASLAHLPLYQRTLILTIVLVPWMAFAALPMLNFIIKKYTNR